MINYTDINECNESTNKLKHRGPDNSRILTISNIYMSFNRLSICDLSDNGMQPFQENNKVVICNGEIYNHTFLKDNFGQMSDSDCGVLLPLFNKLPFNIALRYLDAEFALVYYDGKSVYAARDRYGVRPLFIGCITDSSNEICISSEMKAIPNRFNNVFQLKPNMFLTYTNGELSIKEYYLRLSLSSIIPCAKHMKKILVSAVKKRLMSDKPIGFLLSGGLDSNIIVYIASTIINPLDIVCFTIGAEGSPDIKAAKELTAYLGIKNHHIVNFNINEAFGYIPDVIKCIESYDITTIRASVPQYILGKYIKENTDIRVLLSGEGSDEIHGSYKYFEKTTNKEIFREECLRLLSELCYFDNLRTDRTMAAWGLEVRCPFLDHQYVNYIFTTDPSYYLYSGIEKKLLRSCFNGNMPDDLLYRKKDAFSDSVSSDKENWRLLIISKVGNEYEYYKNLFMSYYPNRINIIPNLWLPKWHGNITDPSATIL
jgi:asparagine synthase (glutamine-hydrolysing)